MPIDLKMEAKWEIKTLRIRSVSINDRKSKNFNSMLGKPIEKKCVAGRLDIGQETRDVSPFFFFPILGKEWRWNTAIPIFISRSFLLAMVHLTT